LLEKMLESIKLDGVDTSDLEKQLFWKMRVVLTSEKLQISNRARAKKW
jgi:hypothetical protein